MPFCAMAGMAKPKFLLKSIIKKMKSFNKLSRAEMKSVTGEL